MHTRQESGAGAVRVLPPAVPGSSLYRSLSSRAADDMLRFLPVIVPSMKSASGPLWQTICSAPAAVPETATNPGPRLEHNPGNARSIAPGYLTVSRTLRYPRARERRDVLTRAEMS